MAIETTERTIELSIEGTGLGPLAPIIWARNVSTKIVVSYEVPEIGIAYRATMEGDSADIEQQIDGGTWERQFFARFTPAGFEPLFARSMDRLPRKVAATLHALLLAEHEQHEAKLLEAYHTACEAVIAGTDGFKDYDADRVRLEIEGMILAWRKRRIEAKKAAAPETVLAA